MDPLSALGLIANTLQLVQLSAKIVSKGNAIFKSATGTLEENAQLKSVCGQIRVLALDLEKSISMPYAMNDHALVAICRSCIEIAEELDQKLSPLAVQGNITRYKSYRQALKSVWHKDAINALASKLELFRGELNTCLLITLRQKADTNALEQVTMFDRLIRSQQDDLHAHFHAYRKENDLTNRLITDEHEKTRRDIIDAMFQMAQWGLNARYPNGFSITYHQANKQAERLAPSIIIESLAFPMQEDRFEGIPEAYRSTFEWVWEAQNCGRPTKGDLCHWFRYGDGVFWISGKAGSGKSTLLKFICNDPRTQQNLSVWAGSDHLVCGHFFFWRSGSALQRSQAGLLRSLLYSALRQHPQLVKSVLAEKLKQVERILTDHIYYSQLDVRDMHSISLPPKFRPGLDGWSLSHLKDTFRMLLRQDSVDVKFCFLVDGLDEYEGNHSEIVDLFKDVANSPRVKICLSSRPLNVCERAFERFPGFRVQDLTENDIRLYIAGKLQHNPDMIRLIHREPDRGNQITQKIINKASGVFLWVMLVVKSLLDGLLNQDTILDLEKRLELLPPDLEDLYRHMIGKIDPVYRPRASKFFQIVSRTEEPPLALILSLADEEDPDCPIKAEIRLMADAEQQRRLTEITTRVRSVCAGLLEVNLSKTQPYDQSRVQFMHRTVLDFFKRPDVREMLHGFTTGTRFQPDIALLGSFILQLKWLLPCRKTADACHDFWHIVQLALVAAGRADADGTNLGLGLMDELDRVASYHWDAAFFQHNPKLSPETAHWTNWMPSEYDLSTTGLENSFITHAVRYQLSSYLRNKLLWDPQGLRIEGNRPLLDVAIPPAQFSGFQAAPAPQSPSIAVIELLLEAGEDPNKQYCSRTPWQNALAQVCHFQPSSLLDHPSEVLTFGQIWTRVLLLLLRYGADFHTEIELIMGSATITRSALVIINQVLQWYDPSGAEELRNVLVSKGAVYQSPSGALNLPPEHLRAPTLQRHAQKSRLRVPYRLRSIVPVDGVRLNLYGAAHQSTLAGTLI